MEQNEEHVTDMSILKCAIKYAELCHEELAKIGKFNVDAVACVATSLAGLLKSIKLRESANVLNNTPKEGE